MPDPLSKVHVKKSQTQKSEDRLRAGWTLRPRQELPRTGSPAAHQIARLLVVAVASFALHACTNRDGESVDADRDAIDEDVSRPMPPESMWGSYDVTIEGDWEGTCTVTIARNAELRDLYAEQDDWVALHRGIYYTDDVAVSDDTWTFTFHIDVDTQGGVDHQRWAFEIPETGVSENGFEGAYTHFSEIIATSTGTIVGTRRP